MRHAKSSTFRIPDPPRTEATGVVNRFNHRTENIILTTLLLGTLGVKFRACGTLRAFSAVALSVETTNNSFYMIFLRIKSRRSIHRSSVNNGSKHNFASYLTMEIKLQLSRHLHVFLSFD